MILVHILIAGFAGWRIASLLVNEHGPFDVFGKIRAWAGVPTVGPQYPKPLIGGVLSCVWCASCYCVPVAWAVGWFTSWAFPGVLAAMAVPPLLETYVRR